MQKHVLIAALAATGLTAGTAHADSVVDTISTNSFNQATLSNPIGQTFTTGVLSDHTLGSIVLRGPSDFATLDLYSVSIFADADGNHATWGTTGSSLGTVSGLTLPGNTNVEFDFSSQGIILQDSTVYAITITNSTTGAPRFALANGPGTPGGPISDGTLFSNGSIPGFGNSYDAAIQVTTVPTPTAIIGTAAMLGVLGVRRRRRLAD